MVAGAVWTSTSYHQGPVDGSYPHAVVAIRAFDGAREDPVFRNSLTAAQKLVAVNRVLAVVVVFGYQPGDQVAAVRDLVSAVDETIGEVPAWLVSMVAVDRRALPSGVEVDQSYGLNQLYVLLASVLDADPRRVLGYGNARDLREVWVSRPSSMSTVVADFSGREPKFPNVLAWHYTNGETVMSALPSSTSPFGRCDHLVAPRLTPAQFAEALGALPVAGLDPWEEVMAMYPSKAAFEAMLDEKLGIDPSNSDKTGRVDTNGLLAFWLKRAMLTLRTGEPNKAFNSPPQLVDHVGVDGVLARQASTPVSGIDHATLQAALQGAISDAITPLANQIAELQRTINNAIVSNDTGSDLSHVN